MKVSDYRLGFIGFGHMAQAICRAIEQAKLVPRSQILFVRRDSHKSKQNEQEFGITSTSLENLVSKSDILILGVRPNQADMVLKDLVKLPVQSKMLVSMLAALPLSYYQKYLGTELPLLRIMPNVAAAVNQGMTVFTYGQNVSLEMKSVTHLLFSCMGEVMEIPEKLMDICCGIAGSGPGFVFRLIEAMARMGEKEGLAYDQAIKMAAQTFKGAAELILKGSKPETLLQQIATPNGTTQAGLKEMSALKVDEHFQKVIKASALRSKELSDGL